MQLKFWELDRYDPQKIVLPADGGVGEVISIEVANSNRIVFREECDEFYTNDMSKAEAIQALQEAIAWIEANA